MDKKQIINALRNGAQAASNTIAENVSAPADLIAMGLRQGGIPINDNFPGGSKWMAEQGLTAPVPDGMAKNIGAAAGLVIPAAAAMKYTNATKLIGGN